MSANSKIEWTHHTFNPWRGCTKVSAGCAHCYAETLSKRNPKSLGVWGQDGDRVVGSEAYWREPLKWNSAAAAAGERHRVFCASLADIFESPCTMPADSVEPVRRARWRLLKLIHDTPHLDWLLLTKRPEAVVNLIVDASRVVMGDDDSQDEYIFWATDWAIGKTIPENVWLGTSCENQQTADERIPWLLKCPAAIRFLSCEPLLGPIDLGSSELRRNNYGHIDWVIVGGESGAGARPCYVEWIREIVEQCASANVACFVKQLGKVLTIEPAGMDAWPGYPEFRHTIMPDGAIRIILNDGKGGDINEWAEDLKVRQMPTRSAVPA